MSERIKQIIGEENYKKVTELLGDKVNIEDIDIIPNNYVTLSRFNKVNDESKTFKTQYEAVKKHSEKVEDIVKKANKENIDEVLKDYQTELNNNKETNKKLKSDIVNMKKETYAKDYMRENKIEEKNIKLLMKAVDFEKVLITDDEATGLKEQIDNFKIEYPDMFPKTNKNSANTNNKGDENNKSGENGQGSESNIYADLLKNSYSSF